MTRLVGLSVAHYPRKVGADFCGFNEHNESKVWVLLVEQALRELGVDVVSAPVGGLRDKVAWLNGHNPLVAVEIHFNGSVNPTISGCETLFYPGSKKGLILANTVHRAYKDVMGNRDRGVKEGWYRMDRPMIVDYAGDVEGDETPDYFLKKTNCPAIILEPDFIAQVSNITTKRFDACIKIAKGIQTYLETLDG